MRRRSRSRRKRSKQKSFKVIQLITQCLFFLVAEVSCRRHTALVSEEN